MTRGLLVPLAPQVGRTSWTSREASELKFHVIVYSDHVIAWAQSNIMDVGVVFKEGCILFVPLYPCKEVDMEWGLDTRYMDT